ncbi:MAG: hypothetical protein ACYCOU_14775 [Sulfobacillus sp.]
MNMPVSFIDITGVNAGRAPFVKGGLRAYYATGSSGIEETAAQILAARSAGMGIALYDQTPSLSVFAVGMADIADIENRAGTVPSADEAVTERRARGWQSTLYVSFSNYSTLKASIKNPEGVWYGIADYSWSETYAIQLLNQNPDWAYVQYGDPASNPHTMVPGTSVPLSEALADINVARASWASSFLPKSPVPAGPVRYVADGKSSLLQQARQRGRSVEEVVATSLANMSSENVRAMTAYLGNGNWNLLSRSGARSLMPVGLVYWI